MNLILNFLNKNWQRLSLQRFGDPSRLFCVMMTPRFRASSHVIVFVLAAGRTNPILVVKLPRVPGDNDRLDREAENLHLANRARAEDDTSIPRVIAYEDFHQHRLLIETAVPGRPMSPAIVRMQPELCTEAPITWLLNLHLATATRSARHDDWFERLVENPLKQFKKMLPLFAEEGCLVDQTLALMHPFRDSDVPLVMEHGDFSSPNILQDESGRAGVVDWELAEPQGLPAADLFFFLTYIAFAKQNARKNADYLKAFQQAFFGPQAWALPYVARYRERLNLAPEMLAPLFIATWGRYVAGLVGRLQESNEAGGMVGDETVKWLRSNRYYILWQHAVEHVKELQVANDKLQISKEKLFELYKKIPDVSK
ncbi:MAG: aminoglycoside phosphotransferase family protein [candidate division KSB1 bacterium]|nr:aminoglycoside phosphotransferase family protein [candidate division KSB1 bacterium]MDZ7365681.1 aminoglycoside phosphotransferase family protein [candidate division KSB1 bacterium]MDZ7403243.1 aminoglycoside phosphotransferase family protein [candidate division KSB1 bacterium]